jgi:small subunit ribosomal protein S5
MQAKTQATSRMTACAKDDRGQPRDQGGWGSYHGFAALTVVGDGDGRIGMGKGKSKEVPRCRAEGNGRSPSQDDQGHPEERHRAPHRHGKHGASSVMISPAKEGTGVIAGGPMRDLRSDGRDRRGGQVHGSTNPTTWFAPRWTVCQMSTTPAKCSPSAASRSKKLG